MYEQYEANCFLKLFPDRG